MKYCFFVFFLCVIACSSKNNSTEFVETEKILESGDYIGNWETLCVLTKELPKKIWYLGKISFTDFDVTLESASYEDNECTVQLFDEQHTYVEPKVYLYTELRTEELLNFRFVTTFQLESVDGDNKFEQIFEVTEDQLKKVSINNESIVFGPYTYYRQ